VPELPIVAIADLHGHRDLFLSLVNHFDRLLGADYQLVTLGDYVDNGPQVPALLDALIALKAGRPDRFFPILGNHDLACLRALGWCDDPPDDAWYARWSARFMDAGGETPWQYGAHSAMQLREKMPKPHRRFLQALPWFHESGGHVFVHAGLEAGRSTAEQLAELRRQELLPDFKTQPHLREKALSTVNDPDWGAVVVSGHTKRPSNRVPLNANAPHFSASHRITLSSEVDDTGVLYAVLLPERRTFQVSIDNPVVTSDAVLR
jgi:hypothetical protein